MELPDETMAKVFEDINMETLRFTRRPIHLKDFWNNYFRYPFGN